MKSVAPRGGIRRHITSAHLIALVALFVALGGISWAAATAPKNSVAAKSIKKNAVTNAKIKNNAVTTRKIKTGAVLGSDIKNDSLTGTDINEGSLGTVPSAATAGSSADQIEVIKAEQSSASNADPAIARSQAAEVPLASHGVVSLYGKCFTDTDSNEIYFETYVKTSVDGAMLQGENATDSAYFNSTLNTTTIEDDRQVQYDDDSGDSVDDDNATGVSVIGPDRKAIYFDVMVYGRVGNPANASPALLAGNSCLWHVSGGKAG